MGIRLGDSKTFKSGVLVSETKAPTSTKSISTSPIHLGTSSKSSSKNTSSIGEQIARARAVPVIKHLFSTPALTGTAVGATILSGGGVVPVIAGAFTTPFIVGALTSSPTLDKAISSRIMHPEKAGQTLGEFIENPIEKVKEGISNIIEKVKESPLISAGIGAGLITAGAIIVPKIADKFKDKDIAIGSPGSIPITPERATIPISATSKKRSKRRTAKKPQSIRQSVKINIINHNRATNNQKYIKERCF